MAVHGYRRFKVRDGKLGGACISLAVWAERTAPPAHCFMVGYVENPAARHCARVHLLADNCSCGYYAYKDRDYKEVPLWNMLFNGAATAAVTMWGAICEYEFGYRAEHMQIDHIWLDGPSTPDKTALALELADRYGVGCDIGDRAPRLETGGDGAFEWNETGCQVIFRRERRNL